MDLNAHLAFARLRDRDLTTVAHGSQATRFCAGSTIPKFTALVQAAEWFFTNPVDRQIARGANRLRWNLDLLGVDVWNRDWDSPPSA